jgi:hypothetical protein
MSRSIESDASHLEGLGGPDWTIVSILGHSPRIGAEKQECRRIAPARSASLGGVAGGRSVGPAARPAIVITLC